MPLFNFGEHRGELIVESLGWMLLHSLWQFVALGIFTAIVLRLLKNRSANERHGVLATSMALSIAIPAATVSLLMSSAMENNQAAIVSLLQVHPKSELQINYGGQSAPCESITLPTASGSQLEDPKLQPQRGAIRTIVQRETARANSLVPTVQRWFGWIVGAWISGVSLCLLRPLLGWRMLNRLRKVGVSAPSEEVLAAFSRVAKKMQVQRPVQVLISRLVTSPLVIGCFRPAILLPASLVTNIPIAQLETLLLHELAHIRRHDFFINLAQRLIESLFFYHPAIWWISNRLTLERENCCDDLVVGLGANRIAYGRALVALGEQTRAIAQFFVVKYLHIEASRVAPFRGNIKNT